ncbi:MAG: hypothetical protein IRY99_15900 [Isosphaeraceae bacterium]|nr:hypothetical protein [Isosphaeraceae bacterium]
MGERIDDETLRAYLAESLPPEASARVEKALRESSELRQRLEDVRQNRDDPSLHTLGAIWRRSRLTCPTRQQLGSYLLDALDPAHARYVAFHLDVVGCPYCQANLADLRSKSDHEAPSRTRQARIFQSSRHLLPREKP